MNYIIGLIIAIFFTNFVMCFAEPAQSVNYDAKKPYIIEEILYSIPQKDTITYTKVPRGIILSIAQSELFDGSSAYLSDNGKILLKYVARLLDTFNNNCTIEAHTEEILENGRIYKEDWEISIVRANVVANYMVYNLGISADRIFPIGFGKIMPFKDNVSEEDFYDNRIDFVIFDYTVSR